MIVRRRDVRIWYGAAAGLGIPWWLFGVLPLTVVTLLYVVAWVALVVATPAIDPRRRVIGFLMSLALTFSLWLATLIVVGGLYGDAEYQEHLAESSAR